MTIPPPDPTTPLGLLPPGEHEATWDEIVERFGGTDTRRRLLAGLEQAVTSIVAAGATRLYLDGSFVSQKELPGDYDACYDIRPAELVALDPVLLDMAWPRDAMKARYLGELFPASFIAIATATGLLTYREFFQQEHGTPKGVLTMDLRSW